MGVPKFYRWLSERYPMINQIISDSCLLPEFDNLYLDMNGIIHACTHPNDDDTASTLTMREMMLGIFRYIDRCVTEIVKPKKLLFLAIDGVAPRAKLNQQRSRRFRAAQDRQMSILKARQRGQEVDEETMFDSNCITPGTEFMNIVSRHLKWFIQKKMKEDPIWRNLEIVFSGHDVPGEGEHKIMQHIRDARAKPGYAPNQRHCMYGQDADLIMLALASHEPHFTLLREVINFTSFKGPNSGSRQVVMKQTREAQFQLLHISLLREYMYLEFVFGRNELTFDKERLIDDFIFMTFLVGNDFLPHLPTLDIGEEAFGVIFDAYKKVQATRLSAGDKNVCYLVNRGEIGDLAALEHLFTLIGEQENDILQTRELDQKEFNSRRRKYKDQSIPTEEELEEKEEALQRAFEDAQFEAEFAAASLVVPCDGSTGVEEKSSAQDEIDIVVERSIKDYRSRYYFEKFKIVPGAPTTETFLHGLMRSYLEGLLWVLAYYSRGCVSWTWYFPFHYGPMLQDMKDLKTLMSEVRFHIGSPFRPFQQLLGCLPPLSRSLLPRKYQWLMMSDQSPIKEFYPDDFEIDMNGKRNPWEAVVKLPFIDEKRLMEAEETFCSPSELTPEERFRNAFGKVLTYVFDPTATHTIPSCNPSIGLADIPNCQSRVTESISDIHPGVCFQPEIIAGTVSPYPGFPSLGVIPLAGVEWKDIKLNVFGSESKYTSLILSVDISQQTMIKSLPPTQLVKLLGHSVYVNYPLSHEAKVVGFTSQLGEIRWKEESGSKVIEQINYSPEMSMKWERDTEKEIQRYLKGRGVPGTGGLNIGDVSMRLRVLPLQGMRRNLSTGARTKVFGKTEADIPICMALWSSPISDPRFEEVGELPLSTVFPYNSTVIALSGAHKGSVGRVVGPHGPNEPSANTRPSLGSSGKGKGPEEVRRVSVAFDQVPVEAAFGYTIAASIQDSYYSSKDICDALGMSPSVLGRIVGSVMVEPGRHDLGLDLKRNGQYQLLGFVRRVVSNDNRDNRNRGRGGRGGDQSSLQTASCWATGDTVHIIGSSATEQGENGEVSAAAETNYWEYSSKTLSLLADYRSQFPKLFDLLRTYSAKYSVDQFGGLAVVERILEWLHSQPFSKMPRTPLSTISMSREAIAAVEQAANKRTQLINSLKNNENNQSLPVITCEYRADELLSSSLHLPTDLPISSSDDETSSHRKAVPTLGDRVVNLRGSGVPFALRGTVIAIHQHTAHVEVLFDEEFVGGKSLQGSCSQFRGRLMPWDQLLRVSDPAKARLETMQPQKPALSFQRVTSSRTQTQTQMQVHTQTHVQVQFKQAHPIVSSLHGKPSQTSAQPPPPPPPRPQQGTPAERVGGGEAGRQQWPFSVHLARKDAPLATPAPAAVASVSGQPSTPAVPLNAAKKLSLEQVMAAGDANANGEGSSATNESITPVITAPPKTVANTSATMGTKSVNITSLLHRSFSTTDPSGQASGSSAASSSVSTSSTTETQHRTAPPGSTVLSSYPASGPPAARTGLAFPIHYVSGQAPVQRCGHDEGSMSLWAAAEPTASSQARPEAQPISESALKLLQRKLTSTPAPVSTSGSDTLRTVLGVVGTESLPVPVPVAVLTSMAAPKKPGLVPSAVLRKKK